MSAAGPFARLLGRLRPSEATTLTAASLVVGLLTGVGVYAFQHAIEAIHAAVAHVREGSPAGLGDVGRALLPALGCLAAGVLLAALVGRERHHGVSGILEAVALGGGRLRYRRIPPKVVGAALAIGSGASVGPEDPSVQIGAGIGSWLGQRGRMSEARVRALVAAGAAAAIASAFRAPIAGVFFALEVLLAEIGAASLGVVLLASVTGAAVTRALGGAVASPLAAPPHEMRHVADLAAYLALGLIAGVVAGAYTSTIDAMRGLAVRSRVPRWLRPALAGLATGAVGLAIPGVLGVGYEDVHPLLHGVAPAVGILLAWLVAKLVLTAACVGFGVPGGVFAPSLVLGAALGAAFGAVVGAAVPGAPPPAACALVGMAAVLAGAVHAPLTALLLTGELTGDYLIMFPTMVAVAASVVVSRRIQRHSVYALPLARRGIRLEGGRDVDVLDGILVGEVMERSPPSLRATTSLVEATEALAASRRRGLPVVDDDDHLVGVLTVADLERARGSAAPVAATVGEACTRDPLVAFEDESLATALRRMAPRDVGRLPVVSRDETTRIVGLLRRDDLVRAYDVALARRVSARREAHEARLAARTGAEVFETTVRAGAPCAGRPISAVAWPKGSLVAGVLRGDRLEIPHGDTVLEPGDVLMVVADPASRAAVRRLSEA